MTLQAVKALWAVTQQLRNWFQQRSSSNFSRKVQFV